VLGYLALLALARLGIGSAVAALGYVALSDDDFARVTIAQQFAVAPKLDPSGTSWLPFPFWLMGAAMRLFDPSLGVARAVSAAVAVAATWLLFAAGRCWGFSPERAFVAALVANLVPSAALLGSLTTPEFFTAALGVFAVVVVTSSGAPSAWKGIAIGAASLAATLSRYEAWPVGAVVAAYAAWVRRDAPARWRAGVALAGVAGPLFWMVDNRILHGDAFSFLHRVASYRAALGSSGSPTRSGAVAVVALAAVPALVFVAFRRARAGSAAAGWPFFGWAAAALGLVLFLTVGDLLGGAPTHHVERTLLFLWLLAVFAALHLARDRRRQAPCAVGFALFLAADAVLQLSDRGINRADEELVGTELRSLVGPGERVYVATEDYGYFAVVAALGRPRDTIIDATHDPRKKGEPSILSDRAQVLDRLQAAHASWLVAPSAAFLPFTLTFRASVGDLSIFERDRRAR
jgi:hypothetical protein